MNLASLRVGQRGAIDTLMDRLRAGEQTTATVLPTRYGKSDVIRLAAILCQEQALSSRHIALTTQEYLRHQLVHPTKLIDMCQRYEIDYSMLRRMRWSTLIELDPFSNDELLLSATMQIATRNTDIVCELVRYHINRDELPVVVHIDECHETSEVKRRGELVTALLKVGAHVHLCTAIPLRADSTPIPGFRQRIRESKDITAHIPTGEEEEIADEIWITLDKYVGKKHLVEIDADHITTFKEAWNEEPSPLCKLSRQVVDVALQDLDPSAPPSSLATCSVSEGRRYLSEAIHNPLVMRKAVDLFAETLHNTKVVNPKAAGIVFSSNDRLGDMDNQHATQIKTLLQKARPAWRCAIVTMKAEEDSDLESTKQIEFFIQGGPEAPDVLIVKQMGGVGLDAGRLKVLLDLSSFRTVSSVMQRLMRVATPWQGMKTGHVITLPDPLMNAVWKMYVQDEGGEIPENPFMTTMNDLEFVESYQVKKRDDPQAKKNIVGAGLYGFDDSHGQEGKLGNYDMVLDLVHRVPELGTITSYADLSVRLDGFTGYGQPVIPIPRHISADIEEKWILFNEEVGARIKREGIQYDKKARDPWVNAVRKWTNAAKRKVGVSTQVSLNEITNVDTLDQMIAFVQSS